MIKTNLTKTKTWAVSLLLLASLVATPTYAASPNWVKSAVRLDIGQRSQGSGVVLNISRASKNGKVKWETYILTNAHNTYNTRLTPISNKKNNTMIMYRHKDIPVPVYVDGVKTKVLKTDKEIDLALLKLTTKTKPKYTAAVLSTADLDVTDWVMSIGFPGGYGPMITGGYVSVESSTGHPEMFLHSANTAKGNSGGAIYRNKKLIGISTRVGFYNGQQLFHVSFAIRMKHILKFLEGYKDLLTTVAEK